jgi:hypothetical protein
MRLIRPHNGIEFEFSDLPTAETRQGAIDIERRQGAFAGKSAHFFQGGSASYPLNVFSNVFWFQI